MCDVSKLLRVLLPCFLRHRCGEVGSIFALTRKGWNKVEWCIKIIREVLSTRLIRRYLGMKKEGRLVASWG